MKISELFKTLHFHDSGLNKIHWRADEKKLILAIDLCNYDQEGYQEGEPEIVAGRLIFSGVEDFKADPPLDTLDEGESGEFSTFAAVPQRDRDGLEAAESIIYWNNYQTHAPVVLILILLAREVEWQPT